jgi:hypothetical protein
MKHFIASIWHSSLFTLFCIVLSPKFSNAQGINCHPCQNIANTNYPYSINYNDPFWIAFKKKIN